MLLLCSSTVVSLLRVLSSGDDLVSCAGMTAVGDGKDGSAWCSLVCTSFRVNVNILFSSSGDRRLYNPFAQIAPMCEDDELHDEFEALEEESLRIKSLPSASWSTLRARTSSMSISRACTVPSCTQTGPQHSPTSSLQSRLFKKATSLFKHPEAVRRGVVFQDEVN